VNYFLAVAEPEEVRVRCAGDDAVEARRVSYGDFDVGRNLAELRGKVSFWDSAQLTVDPLTDRQTKSERSIHQLMIFKNKKKIVYSS